MDAFVIKKPKFNSFSTISPAPATSSTTSTPKHSLKKINKNNNTDLID